MRGGKSTRKLKTISDDRDDTRANPSSGARRLKPESTTDSFGKHPKAEKVKEAFEAKGVVERAKAPQILDTAQPSGSKAVKGFARRGVNGGIQPK